MKNYHLAGRFLFITLAVFALTTASFAQLSLRKALDIDGDGKADYTVFRPSNNVWFSLLSNGGISIQTFGLANEDFVTPGDFDGDNRGDIAVWRDTTGIWFRLNSSDNTFSAVAFGISGDEPVARDYDGDGKTDVAVVRRSNGNMIWYVLRSSDQGFIGFQFGLSSDFTAPGDYDGDGKFDFAVQRPGATPTSQSIFFAALSNGGIEVIPWGISNDLVAPGDYDGDGKTDYAVVREGSTPDSNLVWFIRNSSDGGFTAVTFGLTGSDLLVQNDYDGDGRTDIAVWRNDTGQFFVLNSSNGSLSSNQWGSPNDFPTASYDTH